MFRDPRRFGPRLRRCRVFRRPRKRRPSRAGRGFDPFVQVRHTVDVEHEPHFVVVPTIEFRGLREVGVAAKRDPPKAGRVLVARAVAATIDDVQRFARRGERHDERMITQSPLKLMSVPCLHSPVVASIARSKSIITSAGNASRFWRHTSTRVSLSVFISRKTFHQLKPPAEVAGPRPRCA